MLHWRAGAHVAGVQRLVAAAKVELVADGLHDLRRARVGGLAGAQVPQHHAAAVVCLRMQGLHVSGSCWGKAHQHASAGTMAIMAPLLYVCSLSGAGLKP